jgi:hypothetical protein
MDDKKNEQDLVVGLDGAMTEGLAPAPPPAPPPAQQSDLEAAPQGTTQSSALSEPVVNTMAPPPIDDKPEPPAITTAPEQDLSSGVVAAPNDGLHDQTPAPQLPNQAKDEVDSPLEAGIAPSPISPQEYSQTSQNTGQQPPHHEHRNSKKLAVFMTLFIALVLSAGAVFFYISAQQNASPSLPVVLPTIEPAESLPVEDEATAELLTDEVVEEPISDTDETAAEVDTVNSPPPVAEEPVQEQTIE